MLKKKDAKPHIADVIEALRHRVLISALADFFKESKMPFVSEYLTHAYKEIDRVWEKNDFNSDIPSRGKKSATRKSIYEEKGDLVVLGKGKRNSAREYAPQ